MTSAEQGTYDAGWLAGFDAGVAATELDYQLHLGVARSALSLPSQQELAKARTADNEPCRTRCRSCSRCIRFEQAWRNQRLFGSPDYPGVEQARSSSLARRVRPRERVG